MASFERGAMISASDPRVRGTLFFYRGNPYAQ